jgi:hypothetical protein
MIVLPGTGIVGFAQERLARYVLPTTQDVSAMRLSWTNPEPVR